GAWLCFALTLPQSQPCAGRQLEDALVDRIGRRNVVVAKEQRKRAPVSPGIERRVRAPGLQLGAEQEGVTVPAVVQRFLACAVTRKHERTFLSVPQCDGEHAYAALQRGFDAPGVEAGHQGFRIRVTPPG